MSAPATYIAIIVSLLASTWCWWRIWRSDDSTGFKLVLTLIAGLPIVGPFLYLFADMPPRRRQKPPQPRGRPEQQSAFLKRWNEREHIYLGWASFVFWSLAVVAYWINDWSPGQMIEGHLGWYTEVDVIFFWLLIAAVLTLGAAVRAKVLLLRKLKEASSRAAAPDSA